MPSKHTFLKHCYVAGLQYYDAPKVWNNLEIGQVLTLHAEIDNKYDRHVLAVHFDDIMLGYLTRSENRQIAK